MDLDLHGNMKRSEIKKLIAQSKRKKGLIFYGKPTASLPAGLWRKVGRTLEPVVMFPAAGGEVCRKTFDWMDWGEKLARKVFPKEFAKAFAEAMRSSR